MTYWVGIAFFLCSMPCYSHEVESNRTGHGLWTHWSWDPLVLSSLLVLLFLYLTGLRNLRRKFERHSIALVSAWRTRSFMAALISVFIALISPLAKLSSDFSSVHMVQHMILIGVSAPLFVFGAPGFVMFWALSAKSRKRVGRHIRRFRTWKSPWYLLWQPFFLWGLYAVSLWVWHAPALYQAALRDEWVHHAQHLSFFISASLFWRVLLDPIGRLRMSLGVGVLYLFVTSLHATLLGVFMTLSPRVWYPEYVERLEIRGVAPLEDQQLAGLIMWMPACLVYVLVTAYVFSTWLKEER